MEHDWVIVKFIDSLLDGKIQVWPRKVFVRRCWDSTNIRVLVYFLGTYQDARCEAKRLKEAL